MSVPFEPDEGTARRLLREELADPAYGAARPGPLARALRWLWEQLQSLELPDGPGGVGLAVLLAVLVVALLVALRRVGRPPRPGARADAQPLLDAVTSAAQYRARAARARAGGDHAAAVRDSFRAVVRGCEERALLAGDPGRTADEAAAEAARALPALAAELAAAARRFDEVTYGSRAAGPTDSGRLQRRDDDVAAARPLAPAGSAAAGSGPGSR